MNFTKDQYTLSIAKGSHVTFDFILFDRDSNDFEILPDDVFILRVKSFNDELLIEKQSYGRSSISFIPEDTMYMQAGSYLYDLTLISNGKIIKDLLQDDIKDDESQSNMSRLIIKEVVE